MYHPPRPDSEPLSQPDITAAEPDRRIGDYLALVAEMSREFAGSMNIQSTMNLALQRITDYLDADAGAVFMLEDAGSRLVCRACVGATDILGVGVLISQGIVGKSTRENRCLIVKDAQNDPDFAGHVDAQTGYTTHSILAAPLSVADEVLGCLELINKRDGKLFDERDQAVLEALASAAAMALFNARQAEELALRQRQARELELAADIQSSLLPRKSAREMPVHGLNLPARSVSGDFYDYVTAEDGKVSFILGDVSGKGMNAALVMAKAASLFRLLAKQSHTPSEIAALINDEIAETSTRGMFVTAVIGLFSPITGRVIVANAGHEPSLLVDGDGVFRCLPATAPPLGVLSVEGNPGAFPADAIEMRGGALYIFTDGLTEGLISDGSRFGRERAEALISAIDHIPLPERLSCLVGPLTRRPGMLHDDTTVLVIDDRTSVGCALPELDSRTFPAVARSLKQIRQFVRSTLGRLGCEKTIGNDVVLAIDEAVQNIVRHGYNGGDGSFEIEVVIRGADLVYEIDLLDNAPRVDQSVLCPRDLSVVRPGGLGMNLICEIMDEVHYLPRPDGRPGNLLRMRRDLSRGVSEPKN